MTCRVRYRIVSGESRQKKPNTCRSAFTVSTARS